MKILQHLLLSFILGLAASPKLSGQTMDCGFVDTLPEYFPASTCGVINCYRPDTVVGSRFTPVRNVRLVFHIFLKDSTYSSGFNPGNSAHMATLRDSLMKYVNYTEVLPICWTKKPLV